MTLKYIFDPGGGNETTLTASDVIRHSPVKTHTGVADLRATLVLNRDLTDFAKRQNRLNVEFDGSVKWTGYVTGVTHDTGAGETTIQADGIAKKLEENRPDYASLGGSLTISNTALDTAIDDYWDRTSFSNHSVTSQSTESVATDTDVDSASTNSEWNDDVSISDTTPLAVQNDNLELLQSCFTTEAENNTTESGMVQTSDADASGGEARSFDGDGSSEITFDFTPEYTIPKEDFTFFIRFSTLGGTDPPETTWSLDGEDLFSTDVSTGSDYQHKDALSFFGGTSQPSSDVSGGTTHTLKGRETTSGTDGWVVDVIAPADDRFSYTLDNDNGGNDGFLDGPELFPDAQSIQTSSTGTAFNITALDLSTSWNDTSNSQALAVSNDDGNNFLSGSNTTSIDKSFSGVGRLARAKFTLSRFGSRTTATPQTGFNGQVVQDYDLNADGNDRVVIDELELSRSHFDNLKTLHEYGNFLWVIEHDGSDIGNLTVSSFQEGQETRPTPSNFGKQLQKRGGVNSRVYFNSVYLQGAEDDNNNRPTAEVKDQTAINDDDREISPGVLRDPDVTTEGGAGYRARSLLEMAQRNDQLEGTVVSAPSDLPHPGYARPVDFQDDGNTVDRTVEEVRLSENPNDVREEYELARPGRLAADVTDLRRNAKQIGDRV